MTYKLGCIADDFTGATDLALQIKHGGYSVVQTVGVPTDGAAPQADAVVVALKSRTNPVDDAVAQSLAALAFLRSLGIEQFIFKYCSTFDSTSEGNIGPVADALMDAIGTGFTIVCPAFPVNGRTVYKGNLFVFDQLLSESSMRHHPLTPMTDSNLMQVLGAQTTRKVGLLSLPGILEGVESTRSELAALRTEGCAYAVVDAVADSDLDTIAAAVIDSPLITGGSAIAASLVRARLAVESNSRSDSETVSIPQGYSMVLAGSCSKATLAQIADAKQSMPAYKLSADDIINQQSRIAAVVEWALPQLDHGPVLIYSSESAEQRQSSDAADDIGELIEQCMSTLASALVDAGVRRLIVAGGETSGAVVGGLGVTSLKISQEIDPGVPWTVAETADGDTQIALALKSGNFGAANFFSKAFEVLE